ncbi:Alpha/Beta hydrolase protein [Catenaria anguillulae PL171]|uniref:Alpha/Beta hydrolase protein n=1 Tax=Catenaria anguillulae PL171 TaxID=765915 RepID=A0A1Y2HNN0_9FUNG|nr:Alpha/Beta hydrolase protein [Catenaria anguillulae PL171]
MMTKPLPEESVTVPLPSRDVRLQARIFHAIPGGQASDYGVVISHPYGPLGGDLHNNVVRELAASFGHLGASTLRYNMRGVGKSSGRTSWTAEPEACDLAALIEWWTQDSPTTPWTAPDGVEYPRSRPSKIILVGYSFGSLISLPAARSLPLAGLLLISPPSRVSWALTALRTSHFDQPLPLHLPKLAVLGDKDQFSSESHMLAFVARVFGLGESRDAVPLESVAVDNGREVVQVARMSSVNGKVVVVRDRDHFWVGEEDGVVDVVEAWVRDVFGWVVGDAGPGRNDPSVSSRGVLAAPERTRSE